MTNGSMGQQRSKIRIEIVACFVLFLAVMAIYSNSMRNGFVDYDDHMYVIDNPQVRNGMTLHGFAWAFTKTHAANWHPLTWLSHMLDCSLFGLNPGGHHLMSLALHGANTIILFLFLSGVTGAFWRAFFVALLFAVHPLHVESVAWVAERKDVLSTFFALLSIWAYTGYARDREAGRGKYAAALALFAAGLMAKPMVVTLPFMLLLLDYWPLRRVEILNWKSGWRLFREKIPFFILAAGTCIITIFAQTEAFYSLERLPLFQRLENALWCLVKYLEKTFWPVDLAVFYPLTKIDPGTAVLASVLLASITLLVMRFAKNLPFLPVGWFWYIGTLLPVIGLVKVGSQALADRYTYIPLIGIFIILIWGVDLIARNLKIRGSVPVAFGFIFIAFLAVQSFIQVSYWKNSLTLFRHALAVTKDNYVAHNNVGTIFLLAGKYTEAEIHFREVLRIAPGDLDAKFNLANMHYMQGNMDEAIAGYRDILKVSEFSDTRLNLSAALYAVKKREEAVGELKRFLKDNPENSKALNNMGLMQLAEGNIKEALANIEKAHRIDPGSAEYLYNLERARRTLIDQGRTMD